MSDPLAQLNDCWRVSDDPPAWTLEQKIGAASRKDSGWRARKFIRSRDHLIQRIHQMCGNVQADAVETIKAWPSGYVAWKARELGISASPETGSYSAILELDEGGGDHPGWTKRFSGGLVARSNRDFAAKDLS